MASNMSQWMIKEMLSDMEMQPPGRKEVIFSSLQKVAPSQLLDHTLFDFKSL